MLTVVFFLQRTISSTSGAAEPSATRMNLSAAISTSLAVGSIAWYYHLYGPVAFASAPAEEGYVIFSRVWGYGCGAARCSDEA